MSAQITSQGLYVDSARHTYHRLHDNLKLESNTDVLDALGFSDYSGMPPHLREAALKRGTDVHAGTALLDRKKRWQRKYAEYEGWVTGWMQFKRDFEFKPDIIEEPLHDPLWLIATTPDREGMSNRGRITVQIKTGRVQAWVGLQLSLEERCISLARGGTPQLLSTPHRWAVELKPDGTYKPRQFEDPQDIAVYWGSLLWLRWMRNHGKLIPRKK